MYWLNLEAYKSRIHICKTCENYLERKCVLCDCNIFAKAILPITHCKLNKWDNNPATQVKKPIWFK